MQTKVGILQAQGLGVAVQVVDEVLAEHAHQRKGRRFVERLLGFLRVFVFALPVVQVHRDAIGEAEGRDRFLAAIEDCEVNGGAANGVYVDGLPEELGLVDILGLVQFLLHLGCGLRHDEAVLVPRRGDDCVHAAVADGRVQPFLALLQQRCVVCRCDEGAEPEERVVVKVVAERLEVGVIGDGFFIRRPRDADATDGEAHAALLHQHAVASRDVHTANLPHLAAYGVAVEVHEGIAEHVVVRGPRIEETAAVVAVIRMRQQVENPMLVNHVVVLVQQFDERAALCNGIGDLVDDTIYRRVAAVGVVEVLAVEVAKIDCVGHTPEQPLEVFVGLVVVGHIVALRFDVLDAGLHCLDVAPASEYAHCSPNLFAIPNFRRWLVQA